MPLHGKIVVIKRSGGDGTEFPLTTSCLFGRKAECDIRIQLPQVSKEHCRIDLNENKEIILTNLSSANPTRVNGEALNQSERLKHGDVITVVDRSFRFEYAPAPTPKKRTSPRAKSESLKVLRDQQVADCIVADAGEKRTSEVSTVPHLKDGANYDNIQRSLEKTLEMDSQEDGTNSPFSDLYKMIKKSLEVKTPRKSSASVIQTPSSKFCTPRPASVVKKSDKEVVLTPRKEEDPKGKDRGTPESIKKRRKTLQVPAAEVSGSKVEEAAKSVTASQRRGTLTPQKFTVPEVIEQLTASTSKSTVKRRSKESTPSKSAVSTEQEGQAVKSPKTKNLPIRSRKNSGSTEKVKVSKKRKSGELGTELPTPNMKRKRVSFGGQLSPELFDKRLPPDSPLRKGASPRRSLSLYKPKLSLLRRASVIGLLKQQRTPSPKKLFKKSVSPKTPPGKASPKSVSPTPTKKSPQYKSTSPQAISPGNRSPKAVTPTQKSPKSRSASPAQKSPKSRSASPAQKSPKSRSASPAQKSPKSRSASPKSRSASPKSRSASPKATTPAQKSPKSRSASLKATTPAQKSPKSRSASPKATSPPQKSPKSRSASPKATTPAQKTPKSRSASPKATTPAQKSPKSRSASPKATSPAQKTPKSRSASPKATTPGQKSPKSRSTSPKAATRMTPAKTPLNSGSQTPSVQGRFSVSRIQTPSPSVAVIPQTPSLTVTPNIPLRRKSMKNTSRKTPSVARSAVKVLQRRSGISRASLKVQSSWANIVKFGQSKTSIVALTEKKITQKPLKKTVSKPKTPARKLKGHTSTGHADSPATIVVGRAHKRTVAHPAGAAPKVVLNAVLFKKDMKMDEDLTGLSEMFKTPINERRRRSLVNDSSAKKTPAGASVVEPSVLNTPEEPDEMMVSPLSVASTVKSQRYNSEAVQRLLSGDEESSFVSDAPALEVRSESDSQDTDPMTSSVKTPKQKAEVPVCLTGVKRISKSPRQKAQPLEDIRGKLLKTPKQKAEQQECLTGVRRIFKTPKQKVEPLEDLRGKLLKTPRARKSGVVSLDGVKELLETPIHQSQTPVPATVRRVTKMPKEKNTPVEDMVGVKRLLRTPKHKGEPVEDHFGLKRLMKSPRLRGNPPVEDFEGLQELMEEPMNYLAEQQADKSPDAMEALNMPQQKPEARTTGKKSPKGQSEPSSTSDSLQNKSVRDRRAKTVESRQEETKELPEPPQDAKIPVPARGRKAKKPEDTAPPAVRHTTRGRNAEFTETTEEESLPDPSKIAPKPVRGRRVKRTQDEATELEQSAAAEEEVTPEPPTDPNPAADVDNEGPVSVEKAVLKPKRGRKPKQPEEPAPLQQDLPKHADEDGSMQTEALECVNLTDAEVGKLADEEEAEMCVTPKKSVRGKRAKATEAEHPDKPALAPVRGRRGKKVEATAPAAGKQNRRTRNAKSQDGTVDQPAVQAQVITECSTEAAAVQDSEISNVKAMDAESSAQEVTAKPVRGRRAKVPATESEKAEAVKDEFPPAQAETPQTIPSSGKPRRGRKTKPDVEEPTEAAEDTRLTVETKAPLRAKRGRNALQKEEHENTTSQETSEHKEPPKKSRRTRKPEQDVLKPNDDESAEIVPEKEEAPSAEPAGEQSSVAAKPRRGGRKAKPGTVIETPVVHSDAHEKPKRARKGEQTPQEIVTAENPEEETSVPSPQVIKPSRARGLKQEASQSIQAKRGRRGVALPLREPTEEPPSQTSESSPEPVVSVKRGRRAAAKPKADEEAVETSTSNPNESMKADVQDSKMPKKSVKFKQDLEVCEIPKATPVKSIRGRRSKIPDQADAGSQVGTKEASTTEEKNLSGDIVEPQPTKRGRRAAKVAEVTAEDTEVQPKIRRGRSAKK